MGDEEDRLALVLEALEHVEALLLERGVAHREHLVDQQHVGVHLAHHAEREPHLHARGVVLQLEVHELLELREGDDGVEAAQRLLGREPEHDAVDEHVVAGREIRVEADAELDERGQPPAHADRAAVDPVDAREALQQRALARAVAAHDAEELALADGEGDVVQRLQPVGRRAAQRVQGALLERRDLLVGKAELLRHALHADSERTRHRVSVAAD
jgi:hypothetical protein